MSETRRPELKIIRPSEDENPVPTKARVVHDARGNAVWDWDVATIVLASKTAADLIDTLDAPGPQALSLEREAHAEAKHTGDPYNRAARTKPRRMR